MKYFARLFFTLFFLLSYIPSYSYERRNFSETINKGNQNLVGNLLASKEKKIKEVIVVGVGETIDKASQNAANNALNQVSGSFLDSEKIFSKNRTLNREKININKSFIKNNYSYAPGSINSFEIIETNKEDLLYYVIAKVEVKLNELGTFYKEDLQNKSSNLISDLETKKIYSNGKGSTLDNAIYNAKLNALNQVIGNYLTSELIIKNQKSIREGVVEKLKSFSNKKTSYTQGFIKSYEIKNTKQIGILYEVEGIFEIRLSELNAYIKKIAYGSTKISRGIFFDIATDIQNNESKFDLLYEKLSPLFKSEVVEVIIGEPVIYQNFCDKNGKDKVFNGIGIQLVELNKDKLRITNVLKNSPASKAGLKQGDYLLDIDNNSIKNIKNIDEAVKLIRGEYGTKVDLLIQRGDKTFEKSIKRRYKVEVKKPWICNEGYFEEMNRRRRGGYFSAGLPFDKERTIVIFINLSLNKNYFKNIKYTLENISSKIEYKEHYSSAVSRAKSRYLESDLILTLQNEKFQNNVTRYYISNIRKNNLRQFLSKCPKYNTYALIQDGRPYSPKHFSEYCFKEAKKRHVFFEDLGNDYGELSLENTIHSIKFNFLDENNSIIGGFTNSIYDRIGCVHSNCFAGKVYIDSGYRSVRSYSHLFSPRTNTILKSRNMILFMDLDLETLKRIRTIEIKPIKTKDKFLK